MRPKAEHAPAAAADPEQGDVPHGQAESELEPHDLAVGGNRTLKVVDIAACVDGVADKLRGVRRRGISSRALPDTDLTGYDAAQFLTLVLP